MSGIDITTVIGTLASVLGFIVSALALYITILVLLRVKEIERRYLKKAVLPQFVKELKGFVSNCHTFLDQKDAEKYRAELQICRIELRAIQEVLPKDTKQETTALIDSITSHLDNNDDDSLTAAASQLLGELRGECHRLELHIRVSNWSQGDGN